MYSNEDSAQTKINKYIIKKKFFKSHKLGQISHQKCWLDFRMTQAWVLIFTLSFSDSSIWGRLVFLTSLSLIFLISKMGKIGS